jgi:hypothetical protein
MRALLLIALFATGCRGSLLNPFDPAQLPDVTVEPGPAGQPPVFRWTPPDAEWVSVQEAEGGRIVWRVEEGGRPGPNNTWQPIPVGSPLEYGAHRHGPDWSPPPDNAEPRTTTPPEPLEPGRRYAVTVHRRDARAAASGGGFTGVRPNLYETTVSFTVPAAVPMD